MKLVVGFGNPESKYNWTRHNFGFLTLDFYTKIKSLNWEQHPKFDAIWLKTSTANLGIPKSASSTTSASDEQVIFIKPQTYYNEVGKSIQAFAHFYKIAPQDILAVCDDFDLDFGKIRIREHGSTGGNNGLKSTIRELGTTDFWRLRLGTDSKMRAKSGGKITDIDFVLSKFTPEEKEQLPAILRETCAKIDDFLKN